MNLLFMTMSRIRDISQPGIYTDILRKFRKEHFQVYIVTPHERSEGLLTSVNESCGVHILGVKTLNLQQSSIIEKGVGQLMVEYQYKRAIRKYFPNVHFDLILYSTPPITFTNLIRALQKSNPQAMTYLLLKDIFPQNAVDLGMITKTGLKGILYNYYKRKEKILYRISDFIGCMSPANVDYLLKHNPEVAAEKVEVAPNSQELREVRISAEEIVSVRKKYCLPSDRPVFIYGGNLGKPQGIPFLISCLAANSQREDCHFVIVGSGTEAHHLKSWYLENKPSSVTVLEGLPKEEYDRLVRSCDVGLIFLDHRFTIPNYPSRLLSYLENKMPVLCATDPNTDIGRIAEDNGYGYWCESNSVEAFTSILDKMIHSDMLSMGRNGYDFFKNNYLVENTYNAIISHINV